MISLPFIHLSLSSGTNCSAGIGHKSCVRVKTGQYPVACGWDVQTHENEERFTEPRKLSPPTVDAPELLKARLLMSQVTQGWLILSCTSPWRPRDISTPPPPKPEIPTPLPRSIDYTGVGTNPLLRSWPSGYCLSVRPNCGPELRWPLRGQNSALCGFVGEY
jgi:hypothetical protein